MSKKNRAPVTASPASKGQEHKLSVTIVLPEGMSSERIPSDVSAIYQKCEWLEHHQLSAPYTQVQTDVITFPTAEDLTTKGRMDVVLERLSKTPLSKGTVYIPCGKIAQAKPSYAAQWKHWISGVPERWFSGLDVHKAVHTCTLYPVKEIQAYYQNPFAGKTLTGLDLSKRLYHMQTPCLPLETPRLLYSSKGFWGHTFSGIALAVKQIKKDFIQHPLQSGITFKGAMNDGNAPIYRLGFLIVALVIFLGMTIISGHYNVTWDEETVQESGELVFDYLSSGGTDTTMFNFSEGRNRYTNQHYGIYFDVFAVAVQKTVQLFYSDVNIYGVRHLLNAWNGFLILLFTGLLTWRLLDVRSGILAMLILLFSPSFFGHSFNNPKDIPFALGFVMGLYYLVRTIKEWPRPRLQSRIMLSIGLGYCLGIRAGGLLLFAIVVLFLGIIWLLHVRKSPSIKPYLRYGLPVLILGYLLGIMFWPYALRNPLTGPFKALQEFENFSHLTYYELFEGTRLYLKPWYYIPKYVLITAPLVCLAGIPLIWAYFAKRKRATLEKVAIGLVVFASIFPVAYTIYKGSYLYNGWRHMLFVYPGLVAIAAIGWGSLLQFWNNKVIKGMIWGTMAAVMVPSAWFTISQHPYQYMYFNETVGGVKGANGLYELDYWNQTPRAAMEWIAKNKPELFKGDIPVNSNNPKETLTTFVKGSDSIQYRWTREYEWTKGPWEYAIWTHRTLNKNQILDGYWPPVGTIHTVEVGGIPVCAVVKRPSMMGYFGHQALSSNKIDSAKYYFTQALAQEPLEEEYHRALGAANRAGNDLLKAAEHYHKALQIRDGNYEAYFGLGELHYVMGLQDPKMPDKNLLESSREFLEKAVAYKNNYTSAYFYLGALHMYSGRQNEAMQAYRTLTQVNSNVHYGWQGIGRVFLNLQQVDSALAYLDVAQQLSPNSPDIYQDMARALQLRGDTENARKYLEKARELMP
jgi:cytochrome c-type biogenesis protein CcmH/NrfG